MPGCCICESINEVTRAYIFVSLKNCNSAKFIVVYEKMLGYLVFCYTNIDLAVTYLFHNQDYRLGLKCYLLSLAPYLTPAENDHSMFHTINYLHM